MLGGSVLLLLISTVPLAWDSHDFVDYYLLYVVWFPGITTRCMCGRNHSTVELPAI